MSLVASLLPDGVVCEETAHLGGALDLLPEEEVVVARAVEKRRREFAAVRRCARRALARLGYPAVPILPGERGAPRWPEGVVGSMTHCAGYAAAAVGRVTGMTAVGIDAEVHGPVPDGVLDAIALPDEAAWVRDARLRRPEVHWDRLLFSAKESVYKAWFPLTGRWLDFTEARVSISPDAGTFRAALLVPGPVVGGRVLTGFHGRWGTREGVVATAIAVPAASSP